MGMCRIVFRNGTIVHIAADTVLVTERGTLKLMEKKSDGALGAVAYFAHGVWAYYLWVYMKG